MMTTMLQNYYLHAITVSPRSGTSDEEEGSNSDSNETIWRQIISTGVIINESIIVLLSSFSFLLLDRRFTAGCYLFVCLLKIWLL
jgi:hypothetical protein